MAGETQAHAEALFPEPAQGETARRYNTGILPAQEIRALIEADALRADPAILPEQIQPSSLDLRLGPVAYRVRASFLPGKTHTVRHKIDELGTHELDLTREAVLERGGVYIVPLLESVKLRRGLAGIANPKSSTGRLDIFTRLIADYATEFDRIPESYAGPLYVEVSPRTFSIKARQGSRLIQARLRRGSPSPSAAETRRLHDKVGLLAVPEGEIASDAIERDVPVSVDLHGRDGDGLVGYKARAYTDLVDVDRVAAYPVSEFWEPVYAPEGKLILDPNAFYILVSREEVRVPPDYAAEMLPFNPLKGEFRVHYAGFFDPGFGYSPDGSAGSRAVLEVRSFEVPFLLEHGQTVGQLVYEPLTRTPDVLYGQGIGSNYQSQGLKLSKHFRPD